MVKPVDRFQLTHEKRADGVVVYRKTTCRDCYNRRQNKRYQAKQKLAGLVNLRNMTPEQKAKVVETPMTGEERRKYFLRTMGCKHSRFEMMDGEGDMYLRCGRCGTFWAKAIRHENGKFELTDEKPNSQFPARKRYWVALNAKRFTANAQRDAIDKIKARRAAKEAKEKSEATSP